MNKELRNEHCFGPARLKFFVRVLLLLSIFMNAKSYSDESKLTPLLTVPILELITFNRGEWEAIHFHDLTQYTVIKSEAGSSLRAESKGSASGFLLKKEIDITKTPYLNWRWKVQKALPELSETTKSGDDYAARIYLIHKGGWFFWQTKALNYVWSSRKAKETTWSNAYAPENALMKAVRDKSDETGTWFTESDMFKETLKYGLGKIYLKLKALRS